MRTLIVKLKNEVSLDHGCARLRSLIGEQDLEGVEQLFPGDAEPETASLLEVRIRDSVQVASLLANIQRAAEVEYAHEPSGRRPRTRR